MADKRCTGAFVIFPGGPRCPPQLSGGNREPSSDEGHLSSGGAPLFSLSAREWLLCQSRQQFTKGAKEQSAGDMCKVGSIWCGSAFLARDKTRKMGKGQKWKWAIGLNLCLNTAAGLLDGCKALVPA